MALLLRAWLLCLLAASVLTWSRFAVAKKVQPAFGDRELLSTFPSNPGFPEGVAVFKDKVSGTYFCFKSAVSRLFDKEPLTFQIPAS